MGNAVQIPYKLRVLKWRLFRKSSGDAFLHQEYTRLYGKRLNTETPQTWSEKIFCRMLDLNREQNPLFTKLADKYQVREFIREKIGEEYLVKLIWSGTDPAAIPFDTLPEKCMIKTNHGSGGNIVYKAGADRSAIIAKVRKWLGENYYWGAREYHYYHIPRRVLVEEFLDDGFEDGPLDYRFFCFNGEPEVIQVDNGRHDINPFYDTEWNKLDVTYRDKFKERDIPKPENFDKMMELARVLSKEFDFVRVDLYNLKGKIYFGEMTFTPVAGRFVFKPAAWDRKLGEKWKLARI